MSKDGMYLCAEIGVNWCGELKILRRFAKELAEANVDAVKLQLFDADVIREYPKALKKQLTPMILDPADIVEVSNILKKSSSKPDLIVTPMNQNCLTMLEGLKDHIDGIKIRAKDWEARALVDQARRMGKPMYVSVPTKAGDACIPPKFIDHYASLRGTNVYRVYCVPKYPPEPTDLHLNRVVEHDGVSLHSPNAWTHYAAASIAIMDQYVKNRKRRFYIEVHAYPICDVNVGDLPDFNVSVSVIGIGQLAEALNELEEAIG